MNVPVVLGATGTATVVLVAAWIAALRLDGVGRVIAVVIAVLAAGWLVAFVALFAFVGAIAALLAERHVDAVLVAASAAVGAGLGSDVDAAGPMAFLAIPIVIAMGATAVRTVPVTTPRGRRRVAITVGIVCVVTAGVGATIFP